jgi:hypothetical protein
MKTRPAILALLLAAPLIASEPWTVQDKAVEGMFVASMVADWRQTSMIHTGTWHETNPVMGAHPTQATINRYFLVTTALHAIIADQLHGKARTAWQAVWIGLEVGTVQHNYAVGIRFNL